MADPKRLIEIDEEGHEPFRNWRKSDYADSMADGKAALKNIEKYLPEIWEQIDELEDYAVSLLQSIIKTESVNSAPQGEKPLAQLVEKELTRNGFSTTAYRARTKQGERRWKQDLWRKSETAHNFLRPLGYRACWKFIGVELSSVRSKIGGWKNNWARRAGLQDGRCIGNSCGQSVERIR